MEMETDWVVSEMYEPGNVSINNWARDDQPREKLIDRGPEALTTAELLAILIGTGVEGMSALDLSKQLLAECGDDLSVLGRMSLDELQTLKGIGEAKAVLIQASMELSRRRQKAEMPERPKMKTAEDMYSYMLPRMRDLDTEEAWVLLMNQSFGLIKAVRLSHGGITETAVDIRVIMRMAILNKATVLALCHNHPSGNLLPSRDDDQLTKRTKQACDLMRIHMADHIIVTENGYYSYYEHSKL